MALRWRPCYLVSTLSLCLSMHHVSPVSPLLLPFVLSKARPLIFSNQSRPTSPTFLHPSGLQLPLPVLLLLWLLLFSVRFPVAQGYRISAQGASVPLPPTKWPSSAAQLCISFPRFSPSITHRSASRSSPSASLFLFLSLSRYTLGTSSHMSVHVCACATVGRHLAGSLTSWPTLSTSPTSPTSATCLTFSIKNNCSHFVFISKLNFHCNLSISRVFNMRIYNSDCECASVCVCRQW